MDDAEKKLKKKLNDKLRRELQIAKGLCVRCGAVRGECGTSISCRSCADKANVFNKHKVLTEGIKINLKKRQTYARNKLRGICTKCGNNKGDNGTLTMCRSCADSHEKSCSKYSKTLASNGFCVRCGAPKGADSTQFSCRTCQDKHNTQSKNRVEQRILEGKCVDCGSPDLVTSRNCERCRLITLASDKKQYDKAIAEGKCVSCGKPLLDGSGRVKCVNCSEKGDLNFVWF